jgi:Cdc6-like AAA superfamily ATPase
LLALNTWFSGKRIFKNIGGVRDAKIDDYRSTLFHLQELFLNHATVTTEITALQILDDMGGLSTRLGGISTQITAVSNQVLDASAYPQCSCRHSSHCHHTGLNAMIREIPYAKGSRFSTEKCCLPGTRTAFLDFIIDWVNNPDSERALILFGQAGTGKSAIAHEVARRFADIHRLSSSFINRRAEGSKPYLLFTTLARDLADRYPSFKAALGRAIQDDTSRRIGAQDYSTLFESLLQQPLKDLHLVGPILVVIDALDESGDASGNTGLHRFLADHISELPFNFRIIITSRPEKDIVDVFSRALAVQLIHTDDINLSASVSSDISSYIQKNLDANTFQQYGAKLANKAGGLFQWAAVACGYICNPPPGLTKRKCIHSLVELSPNLQHFDLLNSLYTQVLEGYFTTSMVQRQFQSIMGPLVAAFEPLSIHSLTTLRQFAPVDDSDDSEAVSAIISHLGSLLSNVTSPELPIIPLHASFRDFLTNKESSGEFYINIQDAHHQLVTSCIGLMLHDLKFNICHLGTSYLANIDIPNLQSCITEYIGPVLSYACQFWDDHLKLIPFDNNLISKFHLFFTTKFLFWLEVLSMIGSLSLASLALSSMKVWLAHEHHNVCTFDNTR